MKIGDVMNTKYMTIIGRGLFSTVYRKGKNKVLIKSDDWTKEAMSLGMFPSTVMFPSITRVGISDCGNWFYYEAPYIQSAAGKSLKKSLSSFEWEFYKVLRGINSFTAFNGGDPYRHWRREFQSLPNKFARKRAMLIEALDGLANYGGDMRFEISPRNVAVKNGRLVLLDCFFFESQARIKRNK